MTVVSVALAAPAGAIPACTTTWTGGAGDGLWATAGNWDDGVPEVESVACIPDVGEPGVDVDITLPGSVTVGVHGGRGTNTVDGGAGSDYCSFGPQSETRLRCELP